MLLKATAALGIQELKREIAGYRQHGKNFEQLCINSDLVVKTKIALRKPYTQMSEYDTTCLQLMYIHLNY